MVLHGWRLGSGQPTAEPGRDVDQSGPNRMNMVRHDHVGPCCDAREVRCIPALRRLEALALTASMYLAKGMRLLDLSEPRKILGQGPIRARH